MGKLVQDLRSLARSEFSYRVFSDMQAECSDDVMKLDIGFNDTFTGMIYSAGKTDGA